MDFFALTAGVQITIILGLLAFGIWSSWKVATYMTKKHELEKLHQWILFLFIFFVYWPLGLLLAFIPAKKKEGNT